jgi:hypothetical protein
MSIYSNALRLYAKCILRNGEPEYPVLVFTCTRGNSLALGNLAWMFPMFEALHKKGCLTIVCDNEELKELIKYNFPLAGVDALGEINCRIGHLWNHKGKYSWLYTHVRNADENTPEEYMNNQMLDPLRLNPQPYRIKLPAKDKLIPKYDILIQAHSVNDPNKDWGKYRRVIETLHREYKIGLIGSGTEREYSEQFRAYNVDNFCGKYSLIETMHLVNNARLVIGNDGGLLKVSDNLGVPSIQIFKKWSPVKIRAAIKGINLTEPAVNDVINIIRKIL